MRRVFAVIGFTSLFVCIGCLFLGTRLSLLISVFSAAIFIPSILIKRLRKLPIIWLTLLVMMISALNCFYHTDKINKLNQKYLGENKDLKATFIDYPEKSDTYYTYILKTKDENKIKFSLICDSYLNIKPNDEIVADFEFSDEYADYSEGIYYTTDLFSNEKYKIISNSKIYGFAEIRKEFKGIITNNMVDGGGLAKAIIFGDKSSITGEQYRSLKLCGLLHATATSGLHLSVITGFVVALLSAFCLSKRKISVVSIIFILLFMAVVGFTFSIVRAGIMLIFVYAANLFNRESDAVNSMGFAVAMLVLINPYSALSCSFLLSLASTLGMIVGFSFINKLEEKHKQKNTYSLLNTILKLSSGFVGSVISIIFTLPICIVFFGYFSVVSPIANMILIPFISLILILGVLIIAVSPISFVANILGSINDIFARVVLNVSEFISKFKITTMEVDNNYVLIAILLSSFVVAISIIVYYFIRNNNRVIRICCVLVAICLLSGATADKIISNNKYNLCILKTEKGMTAVLSNNHNGIIIGAGGSSVKRRLQNYLDKAGITDIEMLIIPDEKQINNQFAKLITYQLKPKYVIMNTNSDGFFEVSSANPSAKIYSNEKSLKFKFGDSEIQVLNCKTTSVVLITINKSRIMIADKYLDVDSLGNSYKSANILIANTELPDNYQKINSDLKIVTSSDFSPIFEFEKERILTTGQSSIKIEINNEIIQFRKEK